MGQMSNRLQYFLDVYKVYALSIEENPDRTLGYFRHSNRSQPNYPVGPD